MPSINNLVACSGAENTDTTVVALVPQKNQVSRATLSDVSFSFVGRATPKGDEATCICLLDSFALVGSRSGTIYSLNLDSGSRVEFSKSAQHSSSVLSICSTKHGVLSMDQDSNLILWSKQGTCTASTTLDSALDSGCSLLACEDRGVLVTGSKTLFVGVQKGKFADPVAYSGPVGASGAKIVSFSGSHLLFANGRVINCVLVPASGSSVWSSEAEELVLEANIESISAFNDSGRCLKLLVGLEGGRLQACSLDLGTAKWDTAASTSAPGSILTLFHSKKTTLAIFGTIMSPTLSQLSLGAQASTGSVSSVARQSKRPRDEAASGLVSVASALPAAKLSRSGAAADSVSLAQRLASMAGAAAAASGGVPAAAQTGSDFSGDLGTSSVAVPLSQALNSGNDGLLERCLSGAANETTIRSTVKALSGADALLLLSQLMAKFEKRPSRGAALLVWLKCILQAHAGTLMSVPSLSDKLLPLYQGVNQRMATFKKLLRLQGRLDLLLAHV